MFVQKLIKELPSLVPEESGGTRKAPIQQRARAASQEGSVRAGSPSSVESGTSSLVAISQQHGDKTTEAKSGASTSVAADQAAPKANDGKVDKLEESPGEVAFFKLLHAEFNKAERFFEKAQQEFVIREERVRDGMGIMRQPNSIMVHEKWSLLAKSLYRLYKDLLLLETFAIMTYCSFSKILKKHDKVTGYSTRNAFMANIVNKANFTNYPVVLDMISRCEQMYEAVAEQLLKEGKEDLYEDERLFINMIHRLNEQVMDSAEVEGAPERRQEVRRPSTIAAHPGKELPVESHATIKLRSLLEDNDKSLAALVSEGAAGVHGDDCASRKRAGSVVDKEASDDAKRQKVES